MSKHHQIFAVTLIWITAAIPAQAAGPSTRPTTAPADPGAVVIRDSKYDHVWLSDALEDLRDVSGSPIFVDWGRFPEAGIERETAITGEFKNEPLSAVLAAVFKQAAKDKPAPAVETVDGVVTIATPARMKRLKALIALLNAAAPRHGDADAVPVLDRRFTKLDFDQTDLSDVFGNLADLSGVKLDVDWDALTKAGLTRQTPVTYRIRDESLGDALLGILFQIEPDHAEFSFKPGDGTISITAKLVKN